MDSALNQNINDVNWGQVISDIKSIIYKKFDKRNLKLDIDDLIQDSVIKVFLKIDHYKGDCVHFKAWVNRVAINYCIDQIRASNKSNKLAKEFNINYDFAEQYDAEKEFKIQKIEKLLLNLNEKEITIIQMKFFENKKYVEISNRIDIPVKHLAVVTQRILLKIHKLF